MARQHYAKEPDQDQGGHGQEGGAESGQDGGGRHSQPTASKKTEADQFLVRSWRIICTFSDFGYLDQLASLKLDIDCLKFLFFAAKLMLLLH